MRTLPVLLALLLACAPLRPDPLADAPLRSVAARSGIAVGAAVAADALAGDAVYRDTLAREFSSVTPENAMKWEIVHPDPERFDFERADALVAFAEEHGMRVRGHTLVWHHQLADWVEAVDDPRALERVIVEHVHMVVGRYRGRVASWDVVNEAIAEDGSGLRDSHFHRVLGEAFLEHAFRAAHAADPEALLFYNDYGIEDLNAKSDRVHELARRLLEAGVPLHGVGMQMHVSAAEPPSVDGFDANVRRLLALGLLVDITEMDVRIRELGGTRARALKRQAQVYRELVSARLRLPGLSSITFWGFTDAHSWIDRVFGDDDPLLLDARYAPKPAYLAVRAALARGGEDAGRRPARSRP
jgi:endo-1,4-beta-xylanase